MRNYYTASLYWLLLIAWLCSSKNVLSAAVPQGTSAPLTVAVASNFQFPLASLIAQSDYWSTQSVRLVVGSSGTLYAQLSQGAPFDVFFSADSERCVGLQERQLVGPCRTYALGKLVLFPASEQSARDLRNDNRLDITGKLAIANPKLAPFGAAAEVFIGSLHNAEDLKQQLVLGANVTQAFQFVDSGNAAAGLLAESVLIHAQITLKNQKYSEYVVINSALYPPIIQQVAWVNSSKNSAQAQRFIDFVLSKASQSELAKLGYLPIDDAPQ